MFLKKTREFRLNKEHIVGNDNSRIIDEKLEYLKIAGY